MPNDMKVAILLESLDLGGIGRLSLLLAEGLVKRGYQVDLVLVKKKGEYLDQAPEEVNIVDLGGQRVIFSLGRLGIYLKQKKPAVLIAAKERINILALLAKKIYRVKARLLISVHINNSEEFSNQGIALHRKFLIILLARWTYQWADRVIAVSKGVAEDVKQLFKVPGDKIRVIYNPIINPLLKEKAKEEVEHSWFEDGTKSVIVGMGRLIAQKDFLTLVKSFAQVKKEKPEAKLVIFGEGKARNKLESEIRALHLENDVDMPGFVENPYKYLKRASVFVMSSAWEGFGNVLVEAMAVGTPVVSTNCPSGPAEILDNGKYGLLIPVGDVQAMTGAIIETLNNSPEKDYLIKRAEDFTVEKAVEKYIGLIKGKLE